MKSNFLQGLCGFWGEHFIFKTAFSDGKTFRLFFLKKSSVLMFFLINKSMTWLGLTWYTVEGARGIFSKEKNHLITRLFFS